MMRIDRSFQTLSAMGALEFTRQRLIQKAPVQNRYRQQGNSLVADFAVEAMAFDWGSVIRHYLLLNQ
jgi:hypothetical protein